jgi:hypothetical protein
MVTASAALTAFLQTGLPFWGAELYTITLVGGTVLRVTSFDQNISYSSNTFTAAGPYVKRSKLKIAVGLQASTLELTIVANPGTMLLGIPILEAIAQGKLTGATVNVRRAFMTVGDIQSRPVICNLTGAATGSGDGTICRFNGTVGKVTEVTAVSATIELRDVLYLLNRPTPKNCFQPGCWHTLFDAGCTLSAGPFTVTGATSAGSTTITVNTSLSQDANIPGPPASAPTLSLTGAPANNLPWQGLYVEITYLNAYGETVASPEAFLAVPPGNLCHVNSPPSVTGATAWNCYIGDGSGNEQLQNVTPIAIGTPFTSFADGTHLSGILPPQIPTTGYWSLGRITFTSGALNGLSAFITGSNSSGQLQMSVPLPSAPATGVTFSIIPGCDKTVATCLTKFNNIANYTGCSAIPTPEVGS